MAVAVTFAWSVGIWSQAQVVRSVLLVAQVIVEANCAHKPAVVRRKLAGV